MTSHANHRALLAALAATTCIVALAAPARAAEARSYDIPAGSLEAGLEAFGRQSGEQVLYRVDDVKGRTTNGVKGTLAADKALGQLLGGTGLRVVKGADGALAIAGNGAGGGQAATEGERGALVGSVVDQRTGKRLEGAFVTIVETGQSTTTDERGEFRFPSVRPGDVTVQISYLGYPSISENVSVSSDRRNDVSFSYGIDRNDVEIVVSGFRSARAVALNQERTAENSQTVISSDLLGNFTGSTISDALRRAPGVSFQQNDKTGDGTNIIVRGLSPDYNQVKLNGIALPETTGLQRSANLSNILADSVSKITISKTLLPNQDSAGTGGLVEIETKSPLDRPRRFADFSVQNTSRGSGFGDDFLASGTVSAKFGAEGHFGISASVQYRKLNARSLNYGLQGWSGLYLPLVEGNPAAGYADIDPRTTFPFEEGSEGFFPYYIYNEETQTKAETLTYALASEWQVSDSTNFKFDYLRSKRRATTYNAFLSLGQDDSNYQLRPVPALNGASRYVLASPDLSFSSRLITMLQPNQRETTDSFSFRGASELDAWKLNYKLGYAVGRSRSDMQYSGSFGLPGFQMDPANVLAIATDPRSGTIPSLFGAPTSPGFPQILVNDAGLAQLRPASAARIDLVTTSRDGGGKTRNWDTEFSARRDFAGGMLQYLETGVQYRRSRISSDPIKIGYYFGNSQTASSLGLEFVDAPFGKISSTSRLLALPSQGSYIDFISRLDELSEAGQLFPYEDPQDLLYDDTYTRESELAGYLQGKLQFGKLEVIGGARVTSVKVDAGFANGVRVVSATGEFDELFFQQSRQIVQASATQTNVLPRVLANYRFGESTVLRAGYFVSVARPQIILLSSEQNISLDLQPRSGPSNNQPILSVSNGNPALKPARTENFDIGFEHYDRNVGVIKINLFYKRLKNLLESNITSGVTALDGVILPDDPRFQNLPSNLFVQVSTPVNNPDVATLWGIETAFERQLNFLPGAFAGLGVYANYTYSESSKNQPASWTSKPIYDPNGVITGREQVNFVYNDIPFNQQPKHSGTVGITYNRHGFDATLLYSYQARRRVMNDRFGLHPYQDSTSSLDFHGEYVFDIRGAQARVFVEGNNLLKGAHTPNGTTSIGGGDAARYYTGANYHGGRSVTAGIALTF